MFKFSAVSQIWKKYIQKLNDWDLSLNIKVIGSNITPAFTTNAMTSDFPWLSGDVPRLPTYGIYVSHLIRFTWCCTGVFHLHS